jgi:hypothetical protein
MNRNEEVKPSFLAEFTPHKSTKKNETRTLLAGKFRKDPQETPPPRIIRPVTENRNRQPGRNYRIYFVVIDNPAR